MTKSKTAMGAAFENSGMRPEDVEFDIAIAKYLNSGATIARAFERVRLAKEKLPGGGHRECADNGQGTVAAAGQPVEGGEAAGEMPQGRAIGASSPSNRGGEGRTVPAPRGHPSGALPVREPSVAQRKAAGAVAKASAMSLMDTIMIDKVPIGDYTLSECERIGRSKTREGFIMSELARLVRKTYANADGGMAIRAIATDASIKIVTQKAELYLDATTQ